MPVGTGQRKSEAVAMGKIVKYCSSCDENFSEKFGYCPNCAAPLQAFEMNPIERGSKAADDIIEIPEASVGPPAAKTISFVKEDELLDVPAGTSSSYENSFASEVDNDTIEVANADLIEDVDTASSIEAPPTVPSWTAAGSEISIASMAEESNRYEPKNYTRDEDGGYYVTVIQEKGTGRRNLLLLGSTFLMLTLTVGATVVSMFQKDLGIGAIGDERSLALLLDDVPMPIEEKEEKKDKDNAGGGGGGGKEDPKPVNQGDLPDQTPKPLRPPDPKVYQSDNFELKTPPPSTEGTMKTEKKYGQWGDPNSRFGDLSSGPGSGGGMGTGIGTGAGSGRGTGMGSGSGSGAGSGDGDGYGDGSGSGSRGSGPPPPSAGATTPVKILSKPQAKYNDAGRQNGVQGSVRLKVTLLASGQVGSIVPVTRLPHGLTEQAIAAARQIRFEPARQNGIPVSRTVTIDYSFSIY